ncbi:hypothetical protein [Paenibacillus taichungensis]|uniref:hypothetical protein n=1 Tax=Paenibacillus taichungensis TaxID=484184 RepID=UPI0011B643DC|nr:hypothetical protein [Paenibacillus taichungensis]
MSREMVFILINTQFIIEALEKLDGNDTFARLFFLNKDERRIRDYMVLYIEENLSIECIPEWKTWNIAGFNKSGTAAIDIGCLQHIKGKEYKAIAGIELKAEISQIVSSKLLSNDKYIKKDINRLMNMKLQQPDFEWFEVLSVIFIRDVVPQHQLFARQISLDCKKGQTWDDINAKIENEFNSYNITPTRVINLGNARHGYVVKAAFWVIDSFPKNNPFPI